MIGKGSMARLQINCDIGIFITSLAGHLGSIEDRALPPIIMFRRGPSSTSTPISLKIMEESSMEPGGSTSTLPSCDYAVFLGEKLVSAATTSSSIALTIPSLELCGIKSTTTMQNFVAFRWRILWQSTIYRSPVESGRKYGRVWRVVSSI